MDDKVLLNGIDPITGQPLIPELDLATAAQAAVEAQKPHPAVETIHENISAKTLGLPFGINDPADLKQTGWGMVFHAQEDPEVIAAMKPLLDHRAQQVGLPTKLKPNLPYAGEEFTDWLANLRVAPGDVKPNRVPFYLLVVGDPIRIPFEFTQLLAINYAVGRLHLDSPDAYNRYAQAVVAYETNGGATNTKEAVFFGTSHINDAATNLSCVSLVKPLANGDGEDDPVTEGTVFQPAKLLAQDALKNSLLQFFKRPADQNPPAFVFTATHGLGWPINDDRQKTAQGALLCGDWKGLGFSPVPVPDTQYLAASDVQDANVRNVIAFFFACFGLATPQADKYSFKPPTPPKQIAPQPFFSPLPKALLSASNGPALAVIGHMERAWASSIVPPGAGAQIQAFQNAIKRILTGQPLGMALSDFRDRFGNQAGILNGLLAAKLNQVAVDDRKLASAWMQQNDAEAYMLFGDPAIRLRPEKLQ